MSEINTEGLREQALEYKIKSQRRLIIALVIALVMVSFLSANLFNSAAEARENEREMSRRMYQAVRQGHMLPHTNNANPR